MWRRVDVMCTDNLVARRFTHDLQPPAYAGSSLVDFSSLKMKAKHSFETSVHTRSTRRHIPEDVILYSHRCEKLGSYLEMYCFRHMVEYSSALLFVQRYFVRKLHCVKYAYGHFLQVSVLHTFSFISYDLLSPLATN
jgi:hypothetical protein